MLEEISKEQAFLQMLFKKNELILELKAECERLKEELLKIQEKNIFNEWLLFSTIAIEKNKLYLLFIDILEQLV